MTASQTANPVASLARQIPDPTADDDHILDFLLSHFCRLKV